MSRWPHFRLAWLDAERDVTLLGLVRLAFGVLICCAVAKTLLALPHSGYFGDYFHIPLVPEAWVPSRGIYTLLLVAKGAAAALAALGILARPSLFFAASVGLFLIACDRLEYHNNRYVLELLTLLLAFTPCDRSFTIRDWRAASAGLGPGWAVHVAKLQISLVYAASAGSKLLDPDWRGGQVLHLRYETVARIVAERGIVLPDFARELLLAPWLADVSSKAAIASEFFLAFGLWALSTRAATLWLGMWFHFFIEAAAHVELFSFVMWAAYLLFCVPTLRERTLYYDPDSGARRVAAWVKRLDWLLRFRVTPFAAGMSARFGLCAVDRDGRRMQGLAALALLARGVPLFFPFWPLVLLAARALRSPAPKEPTC
jgi:hypothetical protein